MNLITSLEKISPLRTILAAGVFSEPSAFISAFFSTKVLPSLVMERVPLTVMVTPGDTMTFLPLVSRVIFSGMVRSVLISMGFLVIFTTEPSGASMRAVAMLVHFAHPSLTAWPFSLSSSE